MSPIFLPYRTVFSDTFLTEIRADPSLVRPKRGVSVTVPGGDAVAVNVAVDRVTDLVCFPAVRSSQQQPPREGQCCGCG